MPCLGRRCRVERRERERNGRHDDDAAEQQAALAGGDARSGSRRPARVGGRESTRPGGPCAEVAGDPPEVLSTELGRPQARPAAADADVEAIPQHEVGPPEWNPDDADRGQRHESFTQTRSGGAGRRAPAQRPRARRTDGSRASRAERPPTATNRRRPPRVERRQEGEKREQAREEEQAVHPPVDRRGTAAPSCTMRARPRRRRSSGRRGARRVARSAARSPPRTPATRSAGRSARRRGGRRAHAKTKWSGAPPRSAMTVRRTSPSEPRPTKSASASSSCGGQVRQKPAEYPGDTPPPRRPSRARKASTSPARDDAPGLSSRRGSKPITLLASLILVPTYEYKCPNGHVFEVFKRIADPTPEACPVCGASPVETVLYPVPVHFRGSGFYSTDYGRGGRKRDRRRSRPRSPDQTRAGRQEGQAAREEKGRRGLAQRNWSGCRSTQPGPNEPEPGRGGCGCRASGHHLRPPEVVLVADDH